jgi:hypothetical protein
MQRLEVSCAVRLGVKGLSCLLRTPAMRSTQERLHRQRDIELCFAEISALRTLVGRLVGERSESEGQRSVQCDMWPPGGSTETGAFSAGFAVRRK